MRAKNIFYLIITASFFYNNCAPTPFSNGESNNEATSNGAGNGSSNLAIAGGVNFVSTNGLIKGIAAATGGSAEVVDVSFYMDGPKGQGVALGQTKANLVVFDPLYPGNHGFQFQLPNSYLDGRAHKLYVYGKNTKEEVLLHNEATTIVAYLRNPQGQTFFNSNIRNTCNACHLLVYEHAYELLSLPLKAQSGSAAKNALIETALNVRAHAGGNRCGNANQGVCQQIQNWWTLEFANYPSP